MRRLRARRHHLIASGRIQLVDPVTGERSGGVIEPQTDGVNALGFSPDGSLLAVGGVGPLTVWDVATGRLVAEAWDAGDVYTIAWSPAGGQAVTGGSRHLTSGSDFEIRTWTGPEWTEVSQPVSFQIDWGLLEFSPDGRTLALGASNGSIAVLDAETFQPTGIDDWAHVNGISAMSWSPDGRFVATGGQNGAGRILRVGDGHGVTINSGASAVMAVAWSSDGAVLVSGDVNGDLRLWDARDRFHGGRAGARPPERGDDGDRPSRRSSVRHLEPRRRGPPLGDLTGRAGAPAGRGRSAGDADRHRVVAGLGAILAAGGDGRVRSYRLEQQAGVEEWRPDSYQHPTLGPVDGPLEAVAWTNRVRDSSPSARSVACSRWTSSSSATPAWGLDLPSTGADLAVREEQNGILVAADDGSIMVRRLSDGAALR